MKFNQKFPHWGEERIFVLAKQFFRSKTRVFSIFFVFILPRLVKSKNSMCMWWQRRKKEEKNYHYLFLIKQKKEEKRARKESWSCNLTFNHQPKRFYLLHSVLNHLNACFFYSTSSFSRFYLVQLIFKYLFCIKILHRMWRSFQTLEESLQMWTGFSML